MNFDQRLRAAMPNAPEPAGLNALVGIRVGDYRRRRTRTRRVALGLSATGVAVLVVLLYPAVQAQAALFRMRGALDQVTQLVATRYNIAEDGSRTVAGAIYYDRGMWRVVQGQDDVTLFRAGRRYLYHPFPKCYVVEAADGPFTHNGDIRLSSILRQTSLWGNEIETRTDRVDGRNVTVAVATSRSHPERMTIYADAQTDRPIRVLYDAKEDDRWIRKAVMEFDYSRRPASALFVPEKGLPQFTKEQWGHAVVDALLTPPLARRKIRGGELLIRRVDVAEDGSVFIAFQTGGYLGRLRGKALQLKDDLGTDYLIPDSQVDDDPLNHATRAQGGGIEVAMFITGRPAQPLIPRTLKILVRLLPGDKLARLAETVIVHPNGTTETTWSPYSEDPSTPTTTEVVLSLTVGKATCQARPDYLAAVAYGEWRDALVSELTKAEVRAHFCDKAHDRAGRLRWLNEELSLMDQIEANGGGPYARGSVLDAIREASK